jgi:hypothetical protein
MSRMTPGGWQGVGWQGVGWQGVGWQGSSSQLRIGDAEREEAARILGEHFAAGRLDHQEYDERTDAVWAARTQGDLTPLFRDLPGPTPRGRPMQGPIAGGPRATGWSTGSAGTSRGPRRRLPLLPILLIVLGLALLLDAAWVFWVGLGVAILMRHKLGRAWACGAQASGSRRPPGGSWA